MWMEELANGKFKFVERYTDPYTEKQKKVSVTLTSKSNNAQKEAYRQLMEKINDITNNVDYSSMTLQNLLDEWWEFYIKSVKNSSIRAMKNPKKIVEKNLETTALIKNINPKFLQKFFNTLDNSYEYNKKVRGVLNQAFNYAIDMEYVESNPVTKTKIIKPIETEFDINKTNNKFLEKDEVKLLLDTFRESKRGYRTAFLAEFLYLTGLRFGEAIALTEDNFHYEEKSLDVFGTLDYSRGYQNAIKTSTKTKASRRTIILSDRAIEILTTVINENKRFDEDNIEKYIFIGKTGKPIQLGSFNQSLYDANDRLGKNRINKNISSHIFRHSHISLLAELNLPLKSIMERVGHTDEKTTLQIYTHVTKKQKADIANRLNDLGL